MPRFSGWFLFAALLGAGLPGLAGFAAELTVLLGGWQASPTRGASLVAATGVILSAGYLLWTVQRVLFGPAPEGAPVWADLGWREILPLLLLAIPAVLFGVWPQGLMELAGPFADSLARHAAWVMEVR